MIKTVEDQILEKINHSKKGTLFFTENFLFAGNSKAVSKGLERLVLKNKIARVANGIYVKPKHSKLLGNLTPTIDEIAQAIASRDKARIVPTGNYALNRLGLSTQVPLNAVYLTDAAARKIRIGGRTILFKKATPKNLAGKGQISSLAIQALKAIGNGNVEPEEENRILELLGKEKKENITHDMVLAPEWIRKIMRKSLQK